MSVGHRYNKIHGFCYNFEILANRWISLYRHKILTSKSCAGWATWWCLILVHPISRKQPHLNNCAKRYFWHVLGREKIVLVMYLFILYHWVYIGIKKKLAFFYQIYIVYIFIVNGIKNFQNNIWVKKRKGRKGVGIYKLTSTYSFSHTDNCSVCSLFLCLFVCLK